MMKTRSSSTVRGPQSLTLGQRRSSVRDRPLPRVACHSLPKEANDEGHNEYSAGNSLDHLIRPHEDGLGNRQA